MTQASSPHPLVEQRRLRVKDGVSLPENLFEELRRRAATP
jgi:hypothetical protein